jgi:histidine triad (HIT) family protein
MTEDNCIFCKIAAGTIPSQKVYEDADFYAFRDIHPAAPIHVLVIPRKHVPSLSSCTSEDAVWLGKMMALIAQLAKQLGCAYTDATSDASDARANHGANGFRTVINTGPDGGQEVYHVHAHILAGERPWARMG